MTDSRSFVLVHQTARNLALDLVRNAPDGYIVKVSEPTRTLEQNVAQWPILDAFSKQRQWPVNGQQCWLTPEEWKDILTSAFEKETRPRLAAGMDGGVVMLGRRTSQYGKKRFSEWLDFLHATAVEMGVDITHESRTSMEKSGRA